MQDITLLSLFSGIGAFEKALSNIGVKVDLKGFSEIDKYAIDSYCAVHNVDKSLNIGDIVEVTDLSEYKGIDMVVGGSPCTDFSIAGKMQGSQNKCNECGHEYNPLLVHYSDRGTCPLCGSSDLERTRSSLLIEYLRVIRETKPKYLIYENVKNLLSKTFRDGFEIFVSELEEQGYNVDYKVLNALNYNLPQNRERVIVVGVLGGTEPFTYPESIESTITIRDLLTDGYKYDNVIKEEDKIDTKISPGVRVVFERDYNEIISSDKKIFYCECTSDFQGKTVGIHATPCLRARNTITHVRNGNRIQRLKPIETWLFTGFSKDDFNKAKSLGISDTQLAKQAGNSIAVPVLEGVFRELLNKK